MATGNPTDSDATHQAGARKPIFRFLLAKWSMFDNKKLQLAGPVGVVVALACAEFGAHALAYWPSSPLLWYLDLEVFRPVQYTFVTENEHLVFGDLAQTFCVVAPLLALICMGLMTGARLPLAIASNVSLLYSILLLHGSYVADDPVAAGSGKLSVLWAPSFFLALSVLLMAFISSAAAHRAYWRDIFS
jgi:hypothetical protein